MSGLIDMETPLRELSGVAGLIAALAVTSEQTEISTDSLIFLRDHLRDIHAELRDLWRAALDEGCRGAPPPLSGDAGNIGFGSAAA